MFTQIFQNFFKTNKKPLSPTFGAHRNKGYEDTSIEVEKPEPYVWLKCPPQKRVVEIFAGRRSSASTAASSGSALSGPSQRGDKSSAKKKANTIPQTTKRMFTGRSTGKYNSCIGEDCARAYNPSYGD